jgi:hypothetical protein
VKQSTLLSKRGAEVSDRLQYLPVCLVFALSTKLASDAQLAGGGAFPPARTQPPDTAAEARGQGIRPEVVGRAVSVPKGGQEVSDPLSESAAVASSGRQVSIRIAGMF